MSMREDIWITGDATSLPLADRSVHCCVTSPPYYGLRDYGVAGQIGLEDTPDAYVARLVEAFREVRRVLADDGTLWVNLGDSYASSPPGNTTVGVSAKSGLNGVNGASGRYRETLAGGHQTKRDTSKLPGMKPKDLIGIPWMVAFALRADGWYLRSDIIWAKPNPMPESVTDRPTRAHEYLFLLSKSRTYWYNADAIREPGSVTSHGALNGDPGAKARLTGNHSGPLGLVAGNNGRNKRDVWTVTTQPFPEAHFATMPPELVRPCILAGCPKDGLVLDPFGGAGTVPLVARQEGRRFVYNDLNPDYRRIAERRLADVHHQAPLFGRVA